MQIRVKRFIDISLLVAFLFTFLCFLFFLYGYFTEPSYYSREVQKPADDEFDSSYARLNSIDKIISYCDSFYKAKFPKRTYPGIVSQVIRRKFYHGYSYYTSSNNAMCVFLEPFVKHGASAIVIPDDIVQHANAACSQQSIVGMEIFRRKGYDIRNVGMFDTVNQAGHFAYEVFYDSSWHYFDTNQEPDMDILRRYRRPSVAFLAEHPEIVLEAYHQRKDPEMFKRLVMSYKVGRVNEFQAPNAYIFQKTTKFFTHFGWIIVLAIIGARNWRRKLKAKSVLSSGSQNKDARYAGLATS